jgi:hypothetical protein
MPRVTKRGAAIDIHPNFMRLLKQSILVELKRPITEELLRRPGPPVPARVLADAIGSTKSAVDRFFRGEPTTTVAEALSLWAGLPNPFWALASLDEYELLHAYRQTLQGGPDSWARHLKELTNEALKVHKEKRPQYLAHLAEQSSAPAATVGSEPRTRPKSRPAPKPPR